MSCKSEGKTEIEQISKQASKQTLTENQRHEWSVQTIVC